MLQKMSYTASSSLGMVFLVLILTFGVSALANDNTGVHSVTAIAPEGGTITSVPDQDEAEVLRNRFIPVDPKYVIHRTRPKVTGPVVPTPEDLLQELSRTISYNAITKEVTRHESSMPSLVTPPAGFGFSEGGKGIRNPGEKTEGDLITIMDFSALELVSFPEDPPWRKSVKLLVTFSDENSFNPCTGSLIDPRHVLTAGHCVYDSSEGWAKKIEVIPGYVNGETPYGNAWGLEYFSNQGWVDYGDRNHDYAVILLDRPVGSLTGWNKWMWYVSNEEGCPDFFTDNNFHNPGYPHENPYNGENMYTRYGFFDACPNEFILRINDYSYTGQSGSPAYWDPAEPEHKCDPWCYIVGVLSGGEDPPNPSTDFVRITHAKSDEIDNRIYTDTPATYDLIPLKVRTSPSSIHAGGRLSSMSYVVHNYSAVSWSGKVDVGVYLSKNDIISQADTPLGNHNFTGTFDPKGNVEVTVANPPLIPENTPPGDYWIGVILLSQDFAPTNNFSNGWDASPVKITATGLNVSPDEGFNSSGNVKGPFDPSSKTYTLSHIGASTINWTVSKSQKWLTISSASGTLGPGESTTVTISLNSEANSLGSGSYSDTVIFTNTTNGIGNTSRSVSLTVSGNILNVLIKPSGGGKVTGSGIDCPGACAMFFTPGTTVTLVPTPNNGYAFGSWSNCDSTSGTACSVTMNSAREVTANFTVSSVCTYSINPVTQSFNAEGGTGSVNVTTQGVCPWTATSNASWIMITSDSNGSGNGTLTYTVGEHTGTGNRVGAMTIAGQDLIVTQAGTAKVFINLLLNPGFESGHTDWTEHSSGGFNNIWKDPTFAHTGNRLVYLGGYDTAVDYVFQDATIPSDATQAYVQFWYRIGTDETTTTNIYDTMAIEIRNPVDSSMLATLNTMSNLDNTAGWVQSPKYDVMSFKGQTIQLRFSATTDSAYPTIFLVDDTALMAETSETNTHITLLTPNGGEAIASGSTYPIVWGTSPGAVKFKLMYSIDNGATWKLIAKDVSGTSYPWKVPTLKKTTPSCLIKITGFSSKNIKSGVDKSNAPFTIEVVKITSPVSGNIVPGGGSHNITWKTNGVGGVVASVVLKYSLNRGRTWKTIGTVSGNPESVQWNVPMVAKPKIDKCRMKVLLKDNTGNTIAVGLSDYFTIQ